MSMQRRLINLVGSLVVIIALVAGTLLMALPVYLESIDIRNERAQVAASNRLLVAQTEGLRAKEAELPRIKQELDALRSALPHTPQLDDAVKLALRAASEAGGTLQGVSFSDPAAFIARTTDDVIASLPKSATDVTPTAGSDSETDTGAGADASTTGDSTPTDTGTGAAADPATAASALQVSVSITVTVPSTTATARVLDELRNGPRLLRIDAARASYNADGDVELTVDGVAFVQSKQGATP